MYIGRYIIYRGLSSILHSLLLVSIYVCTNLRKMFVWSTIAIER